MAVHKTRINDWPGLIFAEKVGRSVWSSALKLEPTPKTAQVLRYGNGPIEGGLRITVVWDERGAIRYLGFDEARTLAGLKTLYSNVPIEKAASAAQPYLLAISDIWAGRSGASTLHLAVYGTPFQREVWEKLVAIPKGQVVSYGTIAASINRPKAVRAVGNAVGQNPIALLIPCHRVIQGNGCLSNFGWGDATKFELLAVESA